MSGPEETRVLAGPEQRAFVEKCRQVGPGRDSVVSRTEMIEGRRVGRPVVARRGFVKKCPWLWMAGEDMMRGDQVIVLMMRKRADERIPIGARRQARQMFADDEARDLRRNRLEFS